MERRIKALIDLQAQSFGVRAEIAWRPGYAVLVNDPAQTARALAVAQQHFPAGQVNPQGPMLTGSEDFAFMLERGPGSYLFIGNGADGEPGACMVHNPAYDFNDLNIAPGAAYWIALVQDLLSPRQP
jgi:hippurate hydrolase